MGDARSAASSARVGSLRAELLRWLLVPLSALLIIDSVNVYRNALDAADLAYDRTLLASSRAIAERLRVVDGKVLVDVPYVALDIFGIDTPGRIFYKVSGVTGEFISGYDDFPALPDGLTRSEIYPALVRFYDGVYHDEPLRVAALYQPLFEGTVRGMALIQVGETLHARRALVLKTLRETLWRELLLVLGVGVLAWLAVRRALWPLMQLTAEVERRRPTDLSQFDSRLVQKELRPLVDAINRYTDRLQRLIDAQRRFIADASHQLHTPLTVLKTQVEFAQRQSEQSGRAEVLRALHGTVDRTVRLASQLLSKARAEQGIAPARIAKVDLAEVVRQVCLELAQVAARKRIDLAFENSPAPFVEGDVVLLHELALNLVDNAIRYTSDHGRVVVRVGATEDKTYFEVADSGPGIAIREREKVFEPFYRVLGAGELATQFGSGLGLAIARDIAEAHGATIELDDASRGGLKVVVRFGGP
jgi:two-component system sensor histidine kinase TctE